MEKGQPIDALMKSHPVDAMLFGAMGAVAARLCEALSKSFVGKNFEFMDEAEFQVLEDASQINRVYWRETLFRVYWAAALNMMRHQRWQAACVSAFNAPANLLAFAASLRGLVEAAQDAWYSLGSVVNTLAENRAGIESALNGRMAKTVMASRELEDLLIHFVCARKVGKLQKDMTPTSHLALEPKDYRNAIGLPEEQRGMFKLLYDDLCGICHPTAFSLVSLYEQDGNAVRFVSQRDDLQIRALCHDFEPVIRQCLSLSVTTSALCLKALNWFSMPEVKCLEIERWNFDDVPAWGKAQAVASRGTVH